MAENSKIGWTDHTFNPHIGCTKISPACDNCYAETWDNRFGGGHWGAHAPRRRTSVANWRKPLKWNAEAKRTGQRPKVFCGSLCDWADPAAPPGVLADLFELWRQTPYLRWLPLTKRIGNVLKPGFLPDDWQSGAFDHVGMMATICNQEEADRDIPKLLQVPAAWRGVSIEPMLGSVDLREWLPVCKCGDYRSDHHNDGPCRHNRPDDMTHGFSDCQAWRQAGPSLDWAIAGCESGPNARHTPDVLFRSLRDQCKSAGTAFYLKQMMINGKLMTAPALDGRHHLEFPEVLPMPALLPAPQPEVDG